MTDWQELVTLRVSLARIAQSIGVDHEIPGHPAMAFERIHEAARMNERGWNRLAAIIIEAIEARERETQGVLADLERSTCNCGAQDG